MCTIILGFKLKPQFSNFIKYRWHMKANEIKSIQVTFTLKKNTYPPVQLNTKKTDPNWRRKIPGYNLIFVVPCITLNSEINPTRCNNCVYSSQWLYSTCFGWQFHPTSGVHILYMASGRQVYLCCNFVSIMVVLSL